MSQYLVVMTGVPASGKSTVAKFLEESKGYSRISGDDISVELFGHTYPFSEGEDTGLIWNVIYRKRDEALSDKRNVVIDTTAYSQFRRRELLNIHGLPMPYSLAQHHLLWLKVTPDIINDRTGQKGWSENTVLKWMNDVMWEPPRRDKYRLLEYDNNTPDDLERIRADLKARLR
ncbi:MAG: ATP-binding protein [Candidatus Aenigmarchaeota archaeon]|nr:ATP-binding protein [Candidatus Aenigmarchaeota archaeon]